MDPDREAEAPRGRDDERQTRILLRAAPPPGDDDLVDSRAPDLGHLRRHDLRVAGGVRALRREEAGIEVGRRRVAVLVPVLPRPVVSRRPVPRVVEDGDRGGARGGGRAEAHRCQPHDQEAPQQVPRILSRVADTMQLPGFVDAHCHAFQRALRGRTEGGDFWAWRDLMLETARRLPAEEVRESYAAVYRELRSAGYTAVGEFHYLGLDEARAAAAAAADAGIEIVVLYAAYARGGIDRFRQDSVATYLRELEELREAGVRVGVTPHS